MGRSVVVSCGVMCRIHRALCTHRSLVLFQVKQAVTKLTHVVFVTYTTAPCGVAVENAVDGNA